jgi:hypothetical protein
VRVYGLPTQGRGRPGEPGVVRRVLVRAREEAIFVGLWVMVLSTVNAAAMLAAAIAHH